MSVALMTSSLLLLVVLQFFWLQNSYDKVYEDLRKDTNEIFRTTVLALRDSAVLKNIEHTPSGDSAVGKRTFEFTERIDSMKAGRRLAASEVKVIISSKDKHPDSI